MTGSSIVRGRSARMRATASLTSLSARSVLVSSAELDDRSCDEPSVTVELMCLTPVTPATASSMLLRDLRLELGRRRARLVDVTCTIGTSMLGKRVIGSCWKLRQPEHHQHHEQHERRHRLPDRPGGDVPIHRCGSLSDGLGRRADTASPSRRNVPGTSDRRVSPSLSPDQDLRRVRLSPGRASRARVLTVPLPTTAARFV